MITVHLVDTGVNNLLSICNALEMAGARLEICRHPEDLRNADRIVLPGVGAYRDCIHGLVHGGFVPILNELVLSNNIPILGICVGMQMMARRSYEGGEYEGLGWFDADVVKIQPSDPHLRIPQIGWNTTTFREGEPLAQGLPADPDFYYVHSYYLRCDNPNDIAATCQYGGIITASIRKNNIVATQFHPEKSQDFGLRVLENFLSWQP
ncbi:MAG: imidazole glycerol phosphate synthase subunit HisH [Bacteroidota bacterium]|nr:imidazole glycerol phosphate synthase subunit HisH [Candidatus Kapabacteria bacterium]MDW8219921.1 imidazole glycerol phosphate synthase subunit HisH [Bacteroidota bacterium]